MAEESAEPGGMLPTIVVLLAAVVVLAILGGGLAVIGTDDGPQRNRRAEAADVADEWLRAWSAGDRPAMRALLAQPAPDLDATLDQLAEGVGAAAVRAAAGGPTLTGDEAEVPFDATLELPDIGTWSYEGTIRLVDLDVPVRDEKRVTRREYRVAFTPGVLHPRLTDGRRLVVVSTRGARGELLAADGSPLAAIRGLRPVVGAVAPASPEQAAALGPAYHPGDPVGQNGLQAGLEPTLAGTATAEIRLVQGDETVEVLQTFAGTPGQSVRTTIEPPVQAAAEAALGPEGQPAALVAIRPSTGAVVAIGNRPGNGFNRALLGRYPPGSTFKVVTTTALLDAGVTRDTPISCPSEIKVEGRTIRNAEGEALGDTVFAEAFYRSCNTAFIQLAQRLEPKQLVDAARRMGFDTELSLGTAVGVSQYPEPNGVIDKVSSAIGQGRVLATPLQMAVVASNVAAGGFRAPHLVEGGEPATFTPMPAGMAATLQDLMRRVVAEGTGTAARLPGEPVAGKTGTAEFGTARPPRTHAWFIGFRGDLAVAVLVEDGGFGGKVAAPIAADFLRRIG